VDGEEEGLPVEDLQYLSDEASGEADNTNSTIQEQITK